MKKPRTTLASAGAALILTVALAACSATTDGRDASAGSPTETTPVVSVPAEAEEAMARYGLNGMDAATLVDTLDRWERQDRPEDLMASVRPTELVITAGTEEFSLDMPKDRFYLSVAPYVDQTHECFNHSLTTCTGELGSKEVQVQIMDETNDQVLVDETRTTFENGFVGFWLPREIEGSIRVTYQGTSGEARFATNEEAPTCMTTLKLA